MIVPDTYYSEHPIFFQRQFDDLINWSKQQKATYVYNKCVARGKIALARKIKKKYGVQDLQSDLAVATAWCLISQKK